METPDQQPEVTRAANEPVEKRGKHDATDVTDRPLTATPSLQTFVSFDSALGEDQHGHEPHHMDTPHDQQIVDIVGDETATINADGAQPFDLTQDQQGLQDAVNSGQLAEEQILAIDVSLSPIVGGTEIVRGVDPYSYALDRIPMVIQLLGATRA